jgi:hypothetical protein
VAGDLLRLSLRLDAVASGAVGVVLVAGAAILDGPLGVPAAALVPTGLGLVVWAAALLWLASRPAVNRRAAWTVIAINAVWVLDSVLLAAGWSALTAAGSIVVLAQAAVVVLLADLQYVGLRRA